MFRWLMTLLAFIIFSIGQAQAQELPGTGQDFSTAPAQFDRMTYQTIGSIIQDFEDVCLSVYKSAADNPDKAVTQQDVDWPEGYRSFTDRHSKQIGDVRVDIDINFEASDKKMTTVSEWGGSQMVTRNKVIEVPAVHCTFSLSTETAWQPLGLYAYIRASWWSHNKQTTIQNSASQYAMEQNNHDCETGKIRIPKVFHLANEKAVNLHFNFPRDPDNNAAELAACQLKTGNFNGSYGGGFNVKADGSVVGPYGAQIGRVTANGDIVNGAGQIIGRLSKAYIASQNR